MSKTLGEALDEFLKDTFTVESVYIYHDQDANPHVVVTVSDVDYDYTDVFSTHHNLNAEVESLKQEVSSQQSKLNSLKREKTSIENAIKKLAKYK